MTGNSGNFFSQRDHCTNVHRSVSGGVEDNNRCTFFTKLIFQLAP